MALLSVLCSALYAGVLQRALSYFKMRVLDFRSEKRSVFFRVFTQIFETLGYCLNYFSEIIWFSIFLRRKMLFFWKKSGFFENVNFCNFLENFKIGGTFF